MNIHKNARTTPRSRAMLVQRLVEERWPVSGWRWLLGYLSDGL